MNSASGMLQNINPLKKSQKELNFYVMCVSPTKSNYLMGAFKRTKISWTP